MSDARQRAGEQAAAQYANAEAAAYLGSALILTPENDLTERYRLLLARERLGNLQRLEQGRSHGPRGHRLVQLAERNSPNSGNRTDGESCALDCVSPGNKQDTHCNDKSLVSFV